MQISRETNFETYEGVNHSPEELTRRYKNSILEVYNDKTKTTHILMPIELGEVGMNACCFVNGKWSPHSYFESQYLYIVREYPHIGLVQIGDSIALLNRKSHRQWRRGANAHTLEFEFVYRDPDKKTMPDDHIVYAQAFLQTYMTPQMFAEHLKSGDITKPKVVTDRVWMMSRDNYLLVLYFEDIFVGMCDRDRKYIPCKETVTLVEETLNEFGLQQI